MELSCRAVDWADVASLHVVPANAGTHTPRQSLLNKVSNASALVDGPRRMGPPMRNCASELKAGTTKTIVDSVAAVPYSTPASSGVNS